MDKLNLRPLSEGYSYTLKSQVSTTANEGGFFRRRKDYADTPAIVQVSWSTNKTGYELFNNFYIFSVNEGADPFLADLIIDSSTMKEHICRFVPGSVSTASVRGLAYTISATLEVERLSNTSAFSSSLRTQFASGYPIKLDILPDSNGYSFQEADSVVSAEFEGLFLRTRKSLSKAPLSGNLQWTVNAEQFDYLCAFNRLATLDNSLPFKIDLILTEAAPEEYLVFANPGSFSLKSVSGNSFVVSMGVQVIKNIPDRDISEVLQMLFELYGEDSEIILSGIAHLVNVKMPEVL